MMEHYAIALVLRGLLLCLLTGLTLHLLHKRAAAYQHLVCVLALLLLPVLPLAPQFLPALPLLPSSSAVSAERGIRPPQQPDRLSGLLPTTALPASPQTPSEPMVGAKPSAQVPAGNAASVQGGMALPPEAPRTLLRNVSSVLLTFWGLGAALLLIRLLVALWRLRRLEAGSQETLLGSVTVRISAQVQTPLCWGICKRVILLPEALLMGDQGVCESALRHEQAHLDRWDWLWNLLSELVCAFCWFQPGVWWLRSRMRLESERASDDRVLLTGVAATEYAAHLVEIVRRVGSHNEIAPAMAQSGGMEERMRHILDADKPRYAPTKWLVISGVLALALLLVAALRVSARQTSGQPQPERGTSNRASGKSSFRRVTSASTEQPATTKGGNALQDNAPPAATLDNARSVVPLEQVAWSKAVDGLDTGILITTPGLPDNRHVLLNSRVTYQVLVRNITDRDRSFEFQCSNYGPSNFTPYCIPNDDLPDALRSRSIPDRFRAIGASDDAKVTPAYEVKLAPGESVVIPEVFGLYLGNTDKQSGPRMEAIKVGKNWIAQPITIHPLTSAEAVSYKRAGMAPNASKKRVQIVDHYGWTGQRSVPQFGARLGGKPCFARTQLEVRTTWDRTLTAHTNSVNAEVFSPDSKRLVTGSVDGTAIVWDVTTGRSILTLKGRTAAISKIIYSPGGKLLITGCSDGKIHLWDATTGEQLHTLDGTGGGVCALDVSSDGAKLLGGYENGKVKVWNTGTRQDLVTFAYDNRLLCAAISPDGNNIAAGYADAMLKVWDLPTQHASFFSKKLTKSEGITGMHFDRNNTLYTWDREQAEDGKSKLTVMAAWSLKEGILMRMLCPLPEHTISHATSYDTLTILFGLNEGQAVLINRQAGQVTLNAHEGRVETVAISPDGALGATGGKRNGKGEARIWDIQAHSPAKQAQ